MLCRRDKHQCVAMCHFRHIARRADALCQRDVGQIEMIAPVGVYANQPNPWAETRRRGWGLFWKLALAAIEPYKAVFADAMQQLARKYHPDKNDPATTGLAAAEASDFFKLLNNANEYLKERQ